MSDTRDPEGGFIPALRLSQGFYDNVVSGLIGNVRHSAAHLGEGSDVLGFDTERSTDHGWGLRLQIFADDEFVGPVRQAIDKGLPVEYRGWSVSEPTSGPWTYRINQAQSLRQGEVPTDLFLMELPAPESRPSLGDSGWEAQSFVTISAPVFEGDHVTVDCWGSMPDAAGFATVGGGIGFADVAFEGSSQGGWVMQLYEASRDVAIAASGGSLELRGNLRGMVEGNDSPYGCGISKCRRTA